MKSRVFPLAIFRFDAGPKIGGGHALRCLTLANAMTQAGWQCRFAVNDETWAYIDHLGLSENRRIRISSDKKQEPGQIASSLGGKPCDLLVVDHYRLGAGFEKACRTYAKRIMVIDDLADREHDADILLDQNLGREIRDYSDLVSGRCKLLLGPNYALLRPQFIQRRRRTLKNRLSRKSVKRILICFGMSDAQGLALVTLKTLREIGFSGLIDVVMRGDEFSLANTRTEAAEMGEKVRIFSGVKDMASLMANADLAVGGGGIMSLERCSLGLPTLVVVIAENQSFSAKSLSEAGAVWVIEESLIYQDLLRRKLDEIIIDHASIRRASEAAARICDGAGCSRVLEAIHV